MRLLLVFLILLSTQLSAYPLRDHAKLHKDHVQTTEKFVEKYMKLDGVLNLSKIAKFVKRLELERKALAKDIYNTELIENLELRFFDFKKALKKAKKESQGDAKLLMGYDRYLLPKARELHFCVNDNLDNANICLGIVDEITRGYIPYFIPDAFISYWPRNIDFIKVLKHMIVDYKFKKHSQKVEANNLVVEENNRVKIRSCLRHSKKAGAYINESQIQQLKSCKVDVSRLNPGTSSLWQKSDFKIIDKNRKKNAKFFPREDEKLILSEVILRGHSSPKIKVKFKRGGEKYKVKIKMGEEVYSDVANSQLFQLVGLNQDIMQYRREVVVYLGDKTFEEFRSEFINKNGIESLITYVTAHGGEKGKEWIILHDVGLEARPKREKRISSFQLGSWDLANRREYRALLLLWGWVGQTNTKPENFKFLLEKTDSGYRPLLRLQDVGNAYGVPVNLKKLKRIISFDQSSKVNAFPDSFIKTNSDKSKIKISWNDFSQLKKYFENTTWNDLKWMARQIARIPSDAIRDVLYRAGFAEPVAHLFHIKLIKRRNELVKAFSLEDRYEIYPTPDLKNYTPLDKELLGTIKNGKLVKKVFEGKNQLPHVADNWATFLPSIISGLSLPITRWRDQKTGSVFATSLQGLEGLRASVGANEYKGPVAVTTVPIGVGAQIVFSRAVSPNTQLLNTNGEMRIYKISDRMTLRFGLESPFLQSVLKKVKKVGLTAGIRFYEYEFEFTHYKDDVKEAYLSKIKLGEILKDIKKYASYKLKPLELIKTYHRFGIEGELGVGIYNLKPMDKTEFAITAGIRKSLTRFITRDEYGQLHVYLDNTRLGHGGFNIDLLDLNLLVGTLPLFHAGYISSSFKHKSSDRYLSLPVKDRRDFSLNNLEFRDEEYRALKLLSNLKDENQLEDLFTTNFGIDARGNVKESSIGGLFAFHVKKKRKKSVASLLLPNGEKRNFYRYSITKKSSRGLRPTMSQVEDYFLAKKRKSEVILEMDEQSPKDFIVIARTEDYYQVSDRKRLVRLIDDLNRRYSESPSRNFYDSNILPAQEEVNKYRRIHAQTRTFISGRDFLDKIAKTDISELREKLKYHFYSEDPESGSIDDKGLFKRTVVRMKSRRVVGLLREIKTRLQTPTLENFHKIGNLVTKAVHLLKLTRYGVNFLNNLLGKDGIFVMGDIAGVFPAFTKTQDIQQLQRRRFAGNSWGTYKVVPPIQKFLRYNRLALPSNHFVRSISDSLIFGDLQVGVPSSIAFLYGHDTAF